MTQSAQIEGYLAGGGWLSPATALRKFGCLRLAARIYDARRQGAKIERRIVAKNGKHWAEYRLAEEEQ